MIVQTVIATMFAALTSQPTIAWSGAGWYQTEATASDYRIISGPFASKALCLVEMRSDTETEDYRCYDMEVRPRWKEK
jgi:hypothetical protein